MAYISFKLYYMNVLDAFYVLNVTNKNILIVKKTFYYLIALLNICCSKHNDKN